MKCVSTLNFIFLILIISKLSNLSPETIYEWTPTGTIEYVDAFEGRISIALNSTDTLAVWMQDVGGGTPPYYPRYAFWNNNTNDWNTTGTIEYIHGYATDAALNQDTTIATWLEKGGGRMFFPRYANWSGHDLQPTGTIEYNDASQHAISVALRETDTLVAWIEDIGSGSYYYSRYAFWDNNTNDWSPTGTIEYCRTSDRVISVASNSIQTIATWFEDISGGGGPFYPRYAFWNGSDWSNTGTIEHYNNIGYAINVALDGSTILATWIDDASGIGNGPFYPRYSFWNGSDWSNTGTIEHTTSWPSSISVAFKNSTPVATWFEDASGVGGGPFYPRYSIWNGSDWSNTGTIDSSNSSPNFIYIDSYNPTAAIWLEDLGGGTFYPRYANLGSRSENGDGDGTTTHNVSVGNGLYKIEIFGGITFLVRIPYHHTTHTVHHEGQQLEHVHHHDDFQYVVHPNASQAKTLTIKDGSGTTVANINVPAYE